MPFKALFLVLQCIHICFNMRYKIEVDLSTKYEGRKIKFTQQTVQDCIGLTNYNLNVVVVF